MNDGEALRISAVEFSEEESGEGAAGPGEAESGADTRAGDEGADSAGNSTTGGTSGGEPGESAEHGGDSEGTAIYEGVTADEFEAYTDFVEVRLDALTAGSVVLTFALMMCVGVLAIDKFVGRL